MGAAKNYFKDFDVQETIDEKGHRKKLLIYKGNTWTMTIAEEKVLPRKIIFLVLALIMVGTGIAGNTLNVAGNRGGVPAAAGLVAFIPMFLVVYSCIYSLILKSTTHTAGRTSGRWSRRSDPSGICIARANSSAATIQQ